MLVSQLCRYLSPANVLALALFGVLGIATEAKASTLGFTVPGTVADAGEPDDPVNLGDVFTVNSAISVDALGFYDQANLTGSETVGLYNSSGDLLASATVLLSDPEVSGYLFQSITPVALTAGDTYTVDAFVGDNDWSYGSTAPNQAADVTYDYHDYLYTSSLEFPTETSGAAGGPGGTYYGPNFEIGTGTTSPIPEPSSVIPMSAILLGAAFVARKRTARGSRA